MVTRATNKTDFANALHSFIMQHNHDYGLRHGLTEDQVKAIMEENSADSKVLCEHIYDFLVLEGYIERQP